MNMFSHMLIIIGNKNITAHTLRKKERLNIYLDSEATKVQGWTLPMGCRVQLIDSGIGGCVCTSLLLSVFLKCPFCLYSSVSVFLKCPFCPYSSVSSSFSFLFILFLSLFPSPPPPSSLTPPLSLLLSPSFYPLVFWVLSIFKPGCPFKSGLMAISHSRSLHSYNPRAEYCSTVSKQNPRGYLQMTFVGLWICHSGPGVGDIAQLVQQFTT